MAETSKKYYWLKLKRDFFKRHDIKIVEDMKNGKDYVLFYLKMLVESIDHEGELRFNETIPYNEQMLSVITNTNVDIVRGAMELFVKLKMIEVFDDHTIYMNEVEKMVGKESASAPRVRKHRENLNNNQLLLQCNTDVTKCNTEIDTDTELKKDTDKEIKVTPKKPKVDEQAFNTFWNEYPKKVAKATAYKAWAKVDPKLYETIMTALAIQKASEDWTKENGKFIPHPTTWLNQQRWEDELNCSLPQRKEKVLSD